MKLDNAAKTQSYRDMTEMFSKMKTMLIDVLLEKSLPDESRVKLKDCISIVESFSQFLNDNFKKDDEDSENFLKPLHSGLSRSTESLSIKTKQVTGSRSMSDLQNLDVNGSSKTCPSTIVFDNGDNDYAVTHSASQELNETHKMSGTEGPPDLQSNKRTKMSSLERKQTKLRIKMLRWLKKKLVNQGQDEVTVVGDIYKVEGTDHVKRWCLLHDGKLHCYQSVSDESPELVIPLDNCIAVPTVSSCTKKFPFDVEKDGVKLVTFAARSSKERARWIEVVKSKRSMIPLGDFDDESGEEAGACTSEEETKSGEECEDSGYVIANSERPESAEYVLPMVEDEVQDAGYISVLALESEVIRRRSYKKIRAHHPNITNKSDIKNLIEKETGLYLVSPLQYSSLPRKQRSPAPLPKEATLTTEFTNESQQIEEAIYDTIVAMRFEDVDKDVNNNDSGNSTASEANTNERLDVKSKKGKKKGDKSPTLGRKAQLTKEDISGPMDPSSDCLKTVLVDPNEIIENGIKLQNDLGSDPTTDNPVSMESRFKLREKLLIKEKREQITKLEVLKKHVDYAKDRLIVVNTSGQLKREAIELEHDFLIANLEVVKAKKRLIDIEAEIRELRLFGEKYSGEIQEVERPKDFSKPTKPVLKRRPSKEIGVYVDVVSPIVDRESFNSPGDPPPPRKVLNNVKLFENLRGK